MNTPRGEVEVCPAKPNRPAEGLIRFTMCAIRNPVSEDCAMPYQTTLSIAAPRRGTYNITDKVSHAVTASGVQTGVAHIFVQHTSCSLTITENADPDVRRDLETVLSRVAPDGDPAYRHDTEGPDDMAAHARTMLTDVALTVPVGNGRLLLGTWQGIYLFEHRTSPQQRRIVVTVLGA
ncbi:secondary thiamine-phosphate synthase enzyme YjbQ [Oxalobacteraceae bacterium R-40]|uniref:Secondary thiamine-phosphate synthase enzyme YjbQ n=2 Tax=Keguizhuia sedimenti TaxID=3064264 RepID=A0ABU1BS23_9BURK|nr:secondary thiamine-phosphate synthase enzyme YjbQ [Oxalobacteraceae bacterium R-40]